jgi:hypothetical protein
MLFCACELQLKVSMPHANPVLYPVKWTDIWKMDEIIEEENLRGHEAFVG